MLIKQGSKAHANSNVLKSSSTVFSNYFLNQGIKDPSMQAVYYIS